MTYTDHAAIAGAAAAALETGATVTAASSGRWRIRHTLAVAFGAVSALAAGLIYAGETSRLPTGMQINYDNARTRLLGSFMDQPEQPPASVEIEPAGAPAARLPGLPAAPMTPADAARRADDAYLLLWSHPRTPERADMAIAQLREAAAGEFSPRFERRIENLIEGATVERNWRARQTGLTATAE